MKRKIYFLLERLEISRNERITITLLLIFLTLMSGLVLLKHPVANYDPAHYSELEEIFAEKSRSIQEDTDELLARYEPSTVVIKEQKDDPEQNANSTDSELEPVAAEVVPDSVNINTADREELQKLPGIGPAYADRIVEWRDENGLFTSPDQLLEIRGIGERRLEKMLPYIKL